MIKIDKNLNWFLQEEIPEGLNPNMPMNYMDSFGTEKMWQKLGIRHTLQKYLSVFEKSNLKLYCGRDLYEVCEKEVISLLLTNPQKFINLNNEKYRLCREYFLFTKEFERMNYRSLTDEKLINFVQNFYKKRERAHALGWVGNIVDFIGSKFSRYLLNYLKQQIKEEKLNLNANEAFTILTTPIEESFVQKEYQAYLKILAIPPTKRKIRIAKLVRDFGWLGYGCNGPGWDEKYYENLLASLKKEKAQPAKLLAEKKIELKNLKFQQTKLTKQLSLDKKHQLLFKVARGFVFTKGYRKDVLFHAFWVMKTAQRELARRANLSLKQVRYIYPWELERILREGDAWAEELNARFNYHLRYSEKGNNLILSGQAARQMIESLKIKQEKIKEVQIFEGDCAAPGMARGIVAIINSPTENNKINHADILVSGMTNPDLMPAIRLAKAIVTDTGGLTCHAAIVARELGKPCVIGTKIATKILKDGDLVEVDAEKGIVRKI
ncbi:MAG: PEP-utilizing enzyme [Patescibacteria group bacterium]